MDTYDDLVKIRFALEKDEDGYPPFEVERICAEPLGNGLFRIDNSPWYTRAVSWKDVVRAKENPEGDWDFVEVDSCGGHSTIRVISMNKIESDMVSLLDEIKSRGCTYEQAHDLMRIIAIDVPPEADYRPIRRILETGEAQEKWGFEEGCLQHACE